MVNEVRLNSGLDSLDLMNRCRIRKFQSSAYFPIQKLHCLALSLYGISQKIGITKGYFTLKPGDANGDRCNFQKTPDLIGKKTKLRDWLHTWSPLHTTLYSWACEEYYHVVVVLGTSLVILRHKNLLECRMNSGTSFSVTWLYDVDCDTDLSSEVEEALKKVHRILRITPVLVTNFIANWGYFKSPNPKSRSN